MDDRLPVSVPRCILHKCKDFIRFYYRVRLYLVANRSDRMSLISGSSQRVHVLSKRTDLYRFDPAKLTPNTIRKPDLSAASHRLLQIRLHYQVRMTFAGNIWTGNIRKMAYLYGQNWEGGLEITRSEKISRDLIQPDIIDAIPLFDFSSDKCCNLIPASRCAWSAYCKDSEEYKKTRYPVEFVSHPIW